MKTKSLVLFGVLIIALAAMAVPVMADGTATIAGTMSPAISVTLTNANDVLLKLDPAVGTYTNSTRAQMNIKTNSDSWSITATDELTTAGITKVAAKGIMGEADASNQWVAAGKYLANAMDVTGPTLTHATAGNSVLSSTSNTIETGTGVTGSTGETGYLSFHQASTYDDVTLAAGHNYMMIVTIGSIVQ